MRNPVGWILSLAFAVVATAAWGQAPARPEIRPQPATGVGAAGGTSSLDEQLAACLYLGARNEVEVCKFAKDRLKGEEARQFAEMMIRDHQAALEKLQKFAGHALAASAGPARETSPTAAPRPVARAGGDTSAQWAQIGRECADQCLASTKQELEKKDGPEFDHCFMGLQCAAHKHMID